MVMPPLYSTDGTPFEKKVVQEVWVLGPAYWLLVERTGDMAFGFANLNDAYNAEWGYISMAELRANGAIHLYAEKPAPFPAMKAKADKVQASINEQDAALDALIGRIYANR